VDGRARLFFLTYLGVYFSYNIYIYIWYSERECNSYSKYTTCKVVYKYIQNIYLFHCNSEYCFFLLCIDVIKFVIYSFVIIIGAFRQPTYSHRSRYDLTKIYTCYVQYLFHENFLCACVFFRIIYLIIIVRV